MVAQCKVRSPNKYTVKDVSSIEAEKDFSIFNHIDQAAPPDWPKPPAREIKIMDSSSTTLDTNLGLELEIPFINAKAGTTVNVKLKTDIQVSVSLVKGLKANSNPLVTRVNDTTGEIELVFDENIPEKDRPPFVFLCDYQATFDFDGNLVGQVGVMGNSGKLTKSLKSKHLEVDQWTPYFKVKPGYTPDFLFQICVEKYQTEPLNPAYPKITAEVAIKTEIENLKKGMVFMNQPDECIVDETTKSTAGITDPSCQTWYENLDWVQQASQNTTVGRCLDPKRGSNVGNCQLRGIKGASCPLYTMDGATYLEEYKSGVTKITSQSNEFPCDKQIGLSCKLKDSGTVDKILQYLHLAGKKATCQ